MDKRVIICIGREYGSGGRLVGEKLAEKLEIICFDKDLIHKTAVEHDLATEAIAGADEKLVSWSSMGFPMGIRNPYKADFDLLHYALNDKMFKMQSKTIKAIAAKGSAVIVGRVAAEILKDDPDMISVFIHASKEDRIRRIMALQLIDEKKAEQTIREIDKNRENYHNKYSQQPWGKCSSYDLSISTSKFGIDGAVKAVLAALDLGHRETKPSKEQGGNRSSNLMCQVPEVE